MSTSPQYLGEPFPPGEQAIEQLLRTIVTDRRENIAPEMPFEYRLLVLPKGPTQLVGGTWHVSIEDLNEFVANMPCSHRRQYFCPIAGENECPDCGGFDVCCAEPEKHTQPREDLP